MQRRAYHPDAYLERMRNVMQGLQARTKILEVMEERESARTIQEVASLTVLSYSVSRHHLRLLEAERIVKRTRKRPYKWRLTGKGQRRLNHVGERIFM
ncbi:MAG TPA: hypothetical protein VMW67_03530 [Desulfobacteria bacterium]|nr:hypothetical protein [Desulfobacteria bacterium]